MKKILTANIETPVRQPFTRYSLEHLQQAYSELILDLSDAPSLTKHAYFSGYAQILSGCAPAQTMFGFWIIPAGLIKYNSELYHVPATNVHITPPNVPVCYIYESYISQDPLELTDGSLEYVHQIKNIIITGGISGSGGLIESGYTYLCDYSELLSTPTITDVYPTAVVQTDIAGMAHTGNTSSTNITVTTPYTGWSALTNINTLDQFREVKIDSLFETTSIIARNKGWHQMGTINSTYSPPQPYYTTGSYRLVYDHTDYITYDFYPVGIKIEDNKIYYWDTQNDSGNSYFTNITLQLRYNI